MLQIYLSLIESEQDRSFFEQLYHEHRYTMQAAAFTILNDHHEAEDAVHEAFLRILKHFDKLRGFDCNKLRAYVVIIVKNIAIDMIRKKNRHVEADLEDFIDFLQDTRLAPDQAAIANEGQEKIMRALESVPQTYLDTLSLKLVYGFDNQEIALLLGHTESTVRIHLHRGRKKLIDLLAEGEPDGHVE